MNKKILFSTLLGILTLPVTVFAANSNGNGITVSGIVHAAEQTTLLIASGVVVILWVITGLLFLTAQGAPEKLKSARTALIASVAGTALVIIAGSAIALVSQAFNLGS